MKGKRNGKGKEFYYTNIILVFEREYLKKEKNGKGKEYDNKNNLIFEGEFINGEKNGKGKEYDDKGNAIFEGEYRNGYKMNDRREIEEINYKYEPKKANGLANEYIIYFPLVHDYVGGYLNG